MKKETVLITGSNRGIGLGLVKEFIKHSYNVIASCRKPEKAKELLLLAKQYPKNVTVEKLDVTLESDFFAISGKYKDIPIDIVINNAGIFPEDHSRNGISASNSQDILAAFQTNALGALMTIKSFQANLLKSANPRIINLSSQMGALSAASGFGYSYRMSKVALNMLTCCFAAENKNIITVSLRPGWVKTQMGGSNAIMTVEKSVSKLLKIIENLQAEDSGRFYDIEKKICSW
ncbi:MAG: short chain dehydrogenase family protein [Burkholderiales bacterium]|jgi:NAD(P)-dependent dehydrogenase (short-subunit alcohol dehydrogenase family)|nr:short chain dehydrogenase family protein [Burkholderiales bacterium]